MAEKQVEAASSVEHEITKLMQANSVNIPKESYDALVSKHGKETTDEKIVKEFNRVIAFRINKIAEKLSYAFYKKHGPQSNKVMANEQVYRAIIDRRSEFYFLKVDEPTFDAIMKRIREIYPKLGTQEYVFKDIYTPSTPMANVLGNVIQKPVFNLKTTTNEDADALRKILEEGSNVHHVVANQQIYQQYLMYNDLDIITNGHRTDNDFFNPSLHNPSCYVHPVVAAMFVPKIQSLDDRVLLSDFSRMIRSCHGNTGFVSMSDIQLHYDLTHDPNDAMCFAKSDLESGRLSVFKDLLNRSQVQKFLKESIWNLRAGHFFSGSQCFTNELIARMEGCRASPYDLPHLSMLRDEGMFLKRLLGVFCFRSAIAYNDPVLMHGGLAAIAPRQYPISLVELRPQMPENPQDRPTYNIKKALYTSQRMIDGNRLIESAERILSTNKEVLFFYVNRRLQMRSAFVPPGIPGAMIAQGINVNSAQVMPMPALVPMSEKLNDLYLQFSSDEPTTIKDLCTLDVEGIPYVLKSAVCVRTIAPRSMTRTTPPLSSDEIIVGSFTYLFEYNEGTVAIHKYDPINARENEPVMNRGVDIRQVLAILKKKCTILVYVKDVENNSVRISTTRIAGMTRPEDREASDRDASDREAGSDEESEWDDAPAGARSSRVHLPPGAQLYDSGNMAVPYRTLTEVVDADLFTSGFEMRDGYNLVRLVTSDLDNGAYFYVPKTTLPTR